MVTLATVALIVITAFFLTWERLRPGRSLPRSNGWYTRSIAINLVQLGVTLRIGFYSDTVEFMPRCGFPHRTEESLGAMLLFRDVYQEPPES